MSETWLYLDESSSPDSRASDAFWVGALQVPEPIARRTIDFALSELGKDPEAVTPADRRTLERSYFHASFDSKNAHSWLCRAIARDLRGAFNATKWSYAKGDGMQYQGARLHRLLNILTTLSAIQDEFDAVHLTIAEREGSFVEAHATELPEFIRQQSLESVTRMAGIPMRFPRINVMLVSGAEPGIQTCDFLLWATQRARFEELIATGNRDWVDRVGLKFWAAGRTKDGPLEDLNGHLGPENRLRNRIPLPLGTAFRQPQEISELERTLLFEEIVADLYLARSADLDHRRIGHLLGYVDKALAAVAQLTSQDRRVAGDAMNAIMDAFLMIVDTIPVYDPRSASSTSRATERRLLAAAVNRRELGIILPARWRSPR